MQRITTALVLCVLMFAGSFAQADECSDTVATAEPRWQCLGRPGHIPGQPPGRGVSFRIRGAATPTPTNVT